MKKFLLCVLSCMLMTVVLTGCSACNSCKDFFKKDYTVSFLVEDEVFSSQKVKNGKTVTAPESPEKDGYVFKGWYTDETYTTAYDFSSPIKGKTNIYAWLNALYDVSFVADGETLSTQVVENGSRATVPSTPEKANYTFKGWYSDNAFTTAFDFSAPITADTTVYAWLNALYEVSFVVDGETTSTQVVENGNCATMPNNPEKAGYAFVDWYTDDTFTTAFDFSTPISENTVLYASFVKTYVVSFMIDDALHTSQTVKIGEQAQPIDTPEKDYALFKNWYLDKGFTFTFDFATPIYEDTILYAKFVDAYKVHYTDTEGNILFSELVENGTAPIRPADPEKEGYKLSGWYLDLECTEKYNFDVPFTEDTTLYPLYEKIIKIYTADNLKQIANKPDGIYQLAADINLNGEAWTPIADFSGELNGDGYTISDFTMTTTASIAGFVATNNGVLKNISFEDVVFNASVNSQSSMKAGVIAGVNNGKIENCTFVNIVSTYTIDSTNKAGDYFLGGVVGQNAGEMSQITAGCAIKLNASTYSLIYRTTFTGGMVGFNENNIINSSVVGSIEVWASSSGYNNRNYAATYNAVGGFVGRNTGSIKNSGAQQDIKVTDTVGSYGAVEHYIGGFVRANSGNGEIEHCYAKTSIVANGCAASLVAVGGFIQNNSALIKDCYANCNIETDNKNARIAGFAEHSSKTISTSYATGTITATTVTSIGGFIVTNQQNSTVNGCFSAMEISYTSATNFGVFAAVTESGAYYEKCHFNSECKVFLGEEEQEVTDTNNNVSALASAELYTTATLYDSLRWSDDVWTVDGENLPTLAWEN